MKVLIVGSLNHNPEEGLRESFKEACQEIGAAMARANCEFVVGSSHPKTADWWVLQGAASVEGIHKVWVFRPDDDRSSKLPSNSVGKFEPIYNRMKGPWAGGKVKQILAADGVLIIGGQRASAQVGYSAMALEKPVLAISCFEGAGTEILPQFEPFYEKLIKTRDQVGHLREEWQVGNGKIVVDVLKELKNLGVFRRVDSRVNFLPFLLNCLLFVAWVGLFVTPPKPMQASFFGLLAVSAFLGTSLRGALQTVSNPLGNRSSNALLAEFSAGLILAFALSLFYLTGSFTFTGGFEVISDQTDLAAYQRVGVAMGLLGIAGGWLIESVADKLSLWLNKGLAQTVQRN